jgi:hypothetical protein
MRVRLTRNQRCATSCARASDEKVVGSPLGLSLMSEGLRGDLGCKAYEAVSDPRLPAET